MVGREMICLSESTLAVAAGDLPATVRSPKFSILHSPVTRFYWRSRNDRQKDEEPIEDLFPEIGQTAEGKSKADWTPCSMKENRPAVSILKSDWVRLEEIEAKISLVGRFVKERPPLDSLREKLNAILRPEGELMVGSLTRRSILLRFSSETECRRAWLRNQLVIDGNPLWLSRWRPEQHLMPNRDSPMSLVWIQLPSLPIHLFSFEILSRICAPFGRVVALDSATIRRTRPNVARIRVELDASKPLCDRVWIEIAEEGGKSKGFWQVIEAERMPLYCSICGRFGHVVESCRRRGDFILDNRVEEPVRPPTAWQNAQENSQQELPVEIGKGVEANKCTTGARQNACESSIPEIGLEAHEIKEKELVQGIQDETLGNMLFKQPLEDATLEAKLSNLVAAKEGSTPVDCRNASEGLCCGLSISEQEHMVQEAILEAAENIMEEVADKVMREGCSTPKWADLVEVEDQNGISGKAEMKSANKGMQNPRRGFGYVRKQGSVGSGSSEAKLEPASSTESNRSSLGQGKGLSKNQIRREKRKQSMARKAENKRRGEILNSESSQVATGLSESLMELEVWINKIREVVSKEDVEVFEEARAEVLQFFKHA
ncbi:PREDICTED: uncharacterized protein LOC109177283 [Ipomoea nil]|uniref:uncharacterized protein LOC109177283 n=1 Tax=Ipomoea nil TaxID=35883 RepID=UPI000900E77B|nr:PREDICTED: uncharacterized protein LOC109177283 [Ipomoea nil]